jgi:hypothetical protein
MKVSERGHSPPVERARIESGHGKKRASQAHAQPVERKMREKSGHGKNMSEGGVLTNCQTQREKSRQKEASKRDPLTNCRVPREGKGMIQEEREKAGVTHQLSSAEGARSQGMESNERVRVTHALSRGNGMDCSEDGRTAGQPKGTHDLWSEEGEASEGTERTQARKAHSRAVQCRGRDWSRYRMNSSRNGNSLSVEREWRCNERHGTNQRVRITHRLPSVEDGWIKTQKESG